MAIGPTKNSFLFKTIFSPELNTNDPVDGQQRLAILTHRVKKMEQCDRIELKHDLNKILHETMNPGVHGAEPLQEKGVCVLLLTDSGTHTKSYNFIDSFFRWIRNTFGDRISSQSIVDIIVEIKRQGQNQPVAPFNYQSIKDELAQQKAGRSTKYRAAVDDHDQTERMRKLDNLKKSCRAFNTYLSGKIPLAAKGKIDVVGLSELTVKIRAVLDAAVENELSVEFLHLLTSLKTTVSILQKIGNNNIVEALKDLREKDANYLTESDKDLIQNLEGRAKTPSTNNDVLRNQVIKLSCSAALSKSQCLFQCLDAAYKTEETDVAKLKSDITLIQKRSDFLVKADQMLVVDALISGAGKDLKRYRSEMALLDHCLKEAKSLGASINTMNRSDERVALLRQFIEFRLKADPDKMKSYLSHIMFLYGALSGDKSTYNVVNPLNIERYLPFFASDTEEERSLKGKLRTGLNVDTDSLDEAGKKVYAEHYLEYLQLVLSADRIVLNNMIKKCSEEIARVRSEGMRVLSQASISEATPLIATQPLREPITVPTNQTPEQQLMGLAHQLGNDSVDSNLIFSSFENNPALTSYMNDVYHNFYFIMLKAGRIAQTHSNWGGEVFQGRDLGRLLKGGTSLVDNKFRAQAVSMVSQGIKVSDENDPAINVSV